MCPLQIKRPCYNNGLYVWIKIRRKVIRLATALFCTCEWMCWHSRARVDVIVPLVLNLSALSGICAGHHAWQLFRRARARVGKRPAKFRGRPVLACARGAAVPRRVLKWPVVSTWPSQVWPLPDFGAAQNLRGSHFYDFLTLNTSLTEH